MATNQIDRHVEGSKWPGIAIDSPPMEILECMDLLQMDNPTGQ